MTPALKLANWIRTHVPQKSGDLTHLKLQKLLFYTYGAALAFGHDREAGLIYFEPWQHGPVNREVFDVFRVHGAEAIPPPRERASSYSPEAEESFQAALNVYAWLGPWKLRQQSHLEEPWVRAFNEKRRTIPINELRDFFRQKYVGDVQVPEYLGLRGSFSLDGVPTRRYASIRELSAVVMRSFG